MKNIHHAPILISFLTQFPVTIEYICGLRMNTKKGLSCKDAAMRTIHDEFNEASPHKKTTQRTNIKGVRNTPNPITCILF